MTRKNEENRGLLICGACAVKADPDSKEPSSVEMLGSAIAGIVKHDRPKSKATGSLASHTSKA